MDKQTGSFALLVLQSSQKSFQTVGTLFGIVLQSSFYKKCFKKYVFSKQYTINTLFF